ncbi:L,D-transpeptidase family protein [Nocardioides sp. GCM10027113]|uniref:L,D-transpeptidase family protein n=1 Tax=unclassified Nocardioides TaxID=2615069 RepID=UPI00360BF062
MRLLLLTLLLVGSLLVPAHAHTVTAVPVSAAAKERSRSVTLDGVRVELKKRTRQVVTVNHTGGHAARVAFWAKRDGRWVKRFQATNGRIGYGGLVARRERVQGSGKTPLGTFRLPFAFGMGREREGFDPSYRKVRKGDYWVLDNQSKHYNRYRHRSEGGFRWRLGPGHPDASERLKDYPVQYEFSVVTKFNWGQVRHRGGAIFLHVNGSGATAGCVSAPRWFLLRALNRLDQRQAPVIAIGR